MSGQREQSTEKFMTHNNQKKSGIARENESDVELSSRQEQALKQAIESQENVDYARALLSRSERLRNECSMLLFGKVDPLEIIEQAPVSMRQEVYDMLRPHCSESDLLPLDVDGIAPKSRVLAGQIYSKCLI